MAPHASWASRLAGRVAQILQERARTLQYLADRRAGLIQVGRHSYGRPTIARYGGDISRIAIGSFTSIGNDATILLPGNGHDHTAISTFPFAARLNLPAAAQRPPIAKDVVIGSDVWIGRGALILGGVTIDDGAVIAANSVVTRDVRSYAVVAGNPAREVRRRFDDATVDRLLEMRWWDWPDARIIAEVDVLSSTDASVLFANSSSTSLVTNHTAA